MKDSFKIIVRKNNEGKQYTAYGNIKCFDGKISMIHSSGLTFSEAINNFLNTSRIN